MAGFWHLSHHQMRDPNGRVLAGAKAYFFEADSLLPLTVYQDYGLGTPHPNPVQANAYGVFPPVFLDEADEFYRQRITTSGGVIIPDTDLGTMPIIGPTGGGGGSEVPVDANALFKTGDLIWLDQSGVRAGWVRDNGRTIGTATSGASERANADCENLYVFLWQTYSDTICPVNGGRGSDAASDWSANKYIGLPNKRGHIPIGASGMGNTDSGALDSIPVVSGAIDTVGSVIGENRHALTSGENGPHTHGVTDPAHTHGINFTGGAVSLSDRSAVFGGGNSAPWNSGGGSPSLTVSGASTGISINSSGSGTAHNNVPLAVVGTFYRKL